MLTKHIKLNYFHTCLPQLLLSLLLFQTNTFFNEFSNFDSNSIFRVGAPIGSIPRWDCERVLTWGPDLKTWSWGRDRTDKSYSKETTEEVLTHNSSLKDDNFFFLLIKLMRLCKCVFNLTVQLSLIQTTALVYEDKIKLLTV